MVYSPMRDRVVLVGGGFPALFGLPGSQQPFFNIIGETWEWNSSSGTWSEISDQQKMLDRSNVALGYEVATGDIYAFGGLDQNGSQPPFTPFPTNQMWRLRGSRWSLITTGGPSVRADAAMAYDPARSRFVLFGGSGNTDTWEFDPAASTWTPVMTASSPPPNLGDTMFFNASNGRMTIVVPQVSPAVGAVPELYETQTWEYDPTAPTWTQVFYDTPRNRGFTAVAYDTARDRALLFGGLGTTNAAGSGPFAYRDTWALRFVHFPGSIAFGASCPGALGNPVLAPRDGHFPWIGDTFVEEVTNVMPGAAVTFWFGSQQLNPPVLLPLTTSCFMRIDWLISFPAVADSLGVAAMPLALPDDPSILGAGVLTQATIFEPGANGLSTTVTNGLTAVIGER